MVGYNEFKVLLQKQKVLFYRDIAVRFSLHDVKSLKTIMLFLLHNVANLVSANNLTKITTLKTNVSVLEYFSHLENTYLFSFVPKFGYSQKV